MRDGVPSLISDELRARLDPFLDAFSVHRARVKATMTDPTRYAALPESGVPLNPALWRPRVLDLRLVRRIIGTRKGLRILDVGAWNGWLAHRLGQEGHQVLALDYFTDPHDGLGAVRNYPTSFPAIQFDLERLDLVEGVFDLVIMNRCAAYFEDPARSIAQARGLLAPGGSLLLTGLNIFSDTRRIEAHFAKARQDFQREHGLPYFFKPIKGFQTAEDVRALRKLGVAVRSYPELHWKNLLGFLRPGKPRYFFGILSN